MIIITSDHGQALKEKNYYTHGLFLYDQIIEIPLIVKFPNNKKIIISEHGYQSITHLNKLILNAVDGNILDITEEKVFSESYGFHVPLFKVIKDKNKALEMKNRYGNPRKAVYKNGFKLVINGNNGEIEEFTLRAKILILGPRIIKRSLKIFQTSLKYSKEHRDLLLGNS